MILASQSPDRKNLLKTLIPNFKILVSNTTEFFHDYLTVYENVTAVSLEKATYIKNTFNVKNETIIACDTVCYFNGTTFQKPENRLDAFNMLKSYNNNPLEVITGVAIVTPNKTYNYYVVSTITFNNITDTQINNWLNQNNYMGKSGAFAVDDAKNFFNLTIKGSISNIIGLPLESIKEIFLKEKFL